MGRITIFSVQECPHCTRTKAAFDERGISYVDINLSKYPSKRNDMLSLSDRMSVPQVFVNETHIGGAEETLELLKKWDANLSDSYKSFYETADDPTDPRFAVPDYEPIDESSQTSPREDASILMPDKTFNTVLELTELLKSILPRADLSHSLTTYKNSFTGRQMISAFQKQFGFSSRIEAAEFGRTLQEKNFFDHVAKGRALQDNEWVYRLYCDQNPHILNNYRLWTERVHEDPMRLLKGLNNKLSNIISANTDSKGMVNYKNAAISNNLPEFEEALFELQKVDYENLPYDAKLAFSINVYNLMIKFAFVKLGIGESNIERHAFFNKVSFQIGPDIFSFQDLENGILRGNRKAPYSLFPQFSKGDPRLRMSMEKVDCRIHFALNCGAASCPPVKDFTKQGIDEELRIVSQAFCEDDGNVRIDAENNVVYLSKIFGWYKKDFGESNQQLLESVLSFLRGERKEELGKLLDQQNSGKSVKIKYNDYDWSTDASDYTVFSAAKLKCNVTRCLNML